MEVVLELGTSTALPTAYQLLVQLNPSVKVHQGEEGQTVLHAGDEWVALTAKTANSNCAVAGWGWMAGWDWMVGW